MGGVGEERGKHRKSFFKRNGYDTAAAVVLSRGRVNAATFLTQPGNLSYRNLSTTIGEPLLANYYPKI